MGIRQYKPTTPGRRGGSVSDFADLTRRVEGTVLRVERPEGRKPFATVKCDDGEERRVRVRPDMKEGDRVKVRVKPEKSLLRPLPKKGGRNNQGIICTRFRGGGHKRMYRVIDFKRRKDGVWATVLTVEYDPNRSARIALLKYEDGTKTSVLAPEGLKHGERLLGGEDAEPRPGSSLP